MQSDPANNHNYRARDEFAKFLQGDALKIAYEHSGLSKAALEDYECIIFDMMGHHEGLCEITKTQLAELGPMQKLTQIVSLCNVLIIAFVTALYFKGSILISPAYHIGAIAAVFGVGVLAIFKERRFTNDVQGLDHMMQTAHAKHKNELDQLTFALTLNPAPFAAYIETVRCNLDARMGSHAVLLTARHKSKTALP